MNAMQSVTPALPAVHATPVTEVLAALEQNGLQIISTEQQEDWCRVTAALPEA